MIHAEADGRTYDRLSRLEAKIDQLVIDGPHRTVLFGSPICAPSVRSIYHR